MRKPAIPRVVIAFFLLTFASVAAALAFGPVANSEVVEPDARPTPVFGRLAVAPLNLAFKALNFSAKKGAPATEPRTFTIENTGRSTSTLNVQVEAIGGANPTSFSLSPAAGIITLAQDQKATYTVNFTPIGDGRVTATIEISSSDLSSQRGPTSRTIHLSGVARGPIPTPSFTPTATPTATPTPAMTPTPTGGVSPTPTATPTATGSPSATSTPLAQGPGTVSKNSANAPGVIISGTTVTAYIPLSTDNFAAPGFGQAVIENGANPLPGPATYTADRVGSCTPASSGEVVCSEGNALGVAQFDLVPASTSTTAATIVPSSSSGVIDYLPGECSGCGALVDNTLGTGSLGLGILSASAGFFTLDLGNIANTPLGPITTNPNELPGANFGYDATHHRILNANYQITNVQSGASTPPHFQIIDITTPASPLVYDLTNDQTFFLPGTVGTQCNGANNDNQFPETTAFDSGNNIDIAYVSFHTPPNCQNTPANTVALFDMTQATFTPGTAGASGTWDTPGKQIQALTDFSVNGVDVISIEPTNHLAIVAGGAAPFGALELPKTSGTGTPAITDWVSANMPNDPDGTPWNGWSLPDGVATYVSPNTGKTTGLMLNSLVNGSSVRTGIARYAALVDINALLALPRDQVNGHQVLGTSDGQALVTNNVVKFVLVR
jgi:hypothetical protein